MDKSLQEELILNLPELAKGTSYFSLRSKSVSEDNKFLADSNKDMINTMKKLKEYIKYNYDKINEITDIFEKFQDTQVKMEDKISNLIMDISQEITANNKMKIKINFTI